MGNQEVLYETEKYTIYKGKKLHIRFIEKYYDAVPRPNPEERLLLKQGIQEDGLLEEIRINNQGIVLDGHTRMEVCEECNWKKLNGEPIIVDYIVKEFKTLDEERDYVLKTNLMRRHLNSFQKVKLIYRLYRRGRENPHVVRRQAMYDILLELKKYKDPVKTSTLGDKLGCDKRTINRHMRVLKESFCVGSKDYNSKHKESKGATRSYLWYILPKGEEVLSKGKPMKVSFPSLGKSIGLERNLVSKAIFLMEHANDYMIASLESGSMGIVTAYLQLTKTESQRRVHSTYYLKGNSKVICPRCEQVSMKNQWKLFNDGE